MDSRYKLIISSKSIYKEIELSPEMQEVKIGTTSECTVRLRKELFFSPIELILQKYGKDWSILCGDELYLTAGDARKLLTKKLIHGDELFVKYQESNNEVFSLYFMIDFDYERKIYDIEIDIANQNSVKIGGEKDSDIYCEDPYLEKDTLALELSQGNYVLRDYGSKYGIFVNGARIQGSATIRDYDFFSVAGFSFYYKEGKLYTSSTSNIKIKSLSYKKSEEHTTHFEYPKFNRNSRVQYVLPQEKLEIQQAAQRNKESKRNLIMTLIPSIVMFAMTIVLRGIMGGGGTFVIYSAVSIGIGIVMSIVTYFKEKKDRKEEEANRIKTYTEYIEKKKEKIQESREEELRIRNLIHESLENSIQEVEGFGRRLFEKEVGNKDFLQIYLGKGRFPSANPVEYPKKEFLDTEDSLATLPETVAESYRYLEDAPIISDFYASCGVGVVGEQAFLESMLTNMTLDICIRHFYNEVKLVYILKEEYESKMQWIRWLHNVENGKLDVRNIVCDEESKNLILENLYIILSNRENMLLQGQDVKFDEQYVVFVTDTSEISIHPLSKYIKNCADYGFTFVFFEEHEELLPQGCTEIIRMEDEQSGFILKTENGDVGYQFRFSNISNTIAERLALKLGGVIVDEVSLEGELTKNITMFELLGILSVSDLDLEKRWGEAQVYKSMAAPLGVRIKNQVVSLDISDKAGAHGPHGLVAGTTGSGKSEVLQTYILSIATLYHPYEIGFVIIDFKGGGMANQFKNLPHLIGTITNIDGREINRSLLSIKAELIKRQEIFSKSGVNHINDYIKLYKAGKVSIPLPHLIMIVDEFAELKQEYPEFMKELISAARIGRTLGVHLILATQKPAGVVDAQIWSNSKFKLCLKVQTKEDSNEVIKTPLAAEIVEPGRAYFQVGNNEIFELFQSAYSGASVPEGNESNEKIYTIYEKNFWGKKKVIYTNKRAKTEKESISQLQAIVEYVCDYCEEGKIEQLPGICLPPLKTKIITDELIYEVDGSPAISVPVGFFDDPEQQRQDFVDVDVSKDNIYIVGSSQMGKTVMLQTMLYGFIRKYTAKEVNLYMVDCGSMVLKIFEDSHHVGGVVLASEDEKCRNLFKMLNKIMMERKQIFSGKGVGNYSAYLEGGYHDLPMIVVVIDNMAAFKEYFPEQTEEMNVLAREALSVGISFVVTAGASNALNYRSQANFGRKFVLNCNDTGEYSSVFGHCKITPRENPGAGLFMKEKRILEYQTAIFGRSEKEAERSQELKEFILERNKESREVARKIPMIPEKLSLMKAMQEDVESFRMQGILPIGMDFETVSYTLVNLSVNAGLSLLGDLESKERFVRNFIEMIASTVIFHNIEATIIDDKTKKLQKYGEYGFIKEYTSDTMEGFALVSEFCDIATVRMEMDEKDGMTKMLVINSVDVFKKICADKNESKKLIDLMKSGGEAGAFILFANVENQAVSFNSPDLLKAIKEERQAILFAPLTENKMFDMSGRVKRDTNFDQTMGYRISGSSYSKIKIFD